MYGKRIPEEELASLYACVRKLLDSPAYFEYRQHELKQAPTAAMMRQAQQIWTLVCELNRELENNHVTQAKKKLGHLEVVLARIKQKDYSHLHPVLQKAREILDCAKELLKQDPSLQPKAA